MINNDSLRTLRRVTDAGFSSAREISELNGRQMKTLCKSLKEMVCLLELQETLRNNGDLIAWLTREEDEREADTDENNSFGV